MKKLFRPVCLGSLALCCSLLAGCSNEPNEQQLSQAVQNELQDANAQSKSLLGGILGNTLSVQFIGLKKLGPCTERSDNKTYDCEIKLTTKNSLTGIKSTTTTFAFIKADDDSWVMLDEDGKDDNNRQNNNNTNNSNSQS